MNLPNGTPMRFRLSFALCAVLGCQVSAQTTPVAPLGAFDLGLEERSGPGSEVIFFVARASHLYFAASSPGGYLEFQTSEEGLMESTGSLGSEPVDGFDVDEAGNRFALHGGVRLSEFDREGKFERTLSLASGFVGLSLIGSKPAGITRDGVMRFLEPPDSGIGTLQEYPPPWLLFTVGNDRLGVLRPEAPAIHTFQVEEDGVTNEVSVALASSIVASRKPIAAAADASGTIYLLGSASSPGRVSVIECNEHGEEKFTFDYATPGAFQPRMIAVGSERVYLADPFGKIVFYPRNAAPTRILDSDPRLLSDLEPVKDATGKAGFREQVVVKLEVGEDGFPKNARIASLAALNGVSEVMEAIQAWRFQPATKSGRPVQVPMEFQIALQ